jgi:UDP-N-acetylmuramoylalanine--D-glutamate ligase
VDKLKEDDFVSLEVSSFQLETIGKFKPEIALILNLSRNHLDRHKDMAEYIAAKKRIFMNQDESDFLVLNADDARVKEFGKEARAKKIYFKSGGGLNPNQAAVSAVAGILGISKEIVSCVFRDFKGIEHRMEYLCGTGPVRFINDSKATTAESTLWALRNIPDEVILIAGGRDKGVDYAIIREEARRKVRRLILIGEAKDKIAAALEGAVDIEKAATLEEAVEKANFFAKPKDTVLLSPMCSSFDMFRDYEERGRCFKQAVAGLRKKAKVNLS